MSMREAFRKAGIQTSQTQQSNPRNRRNRQERHGDGNRGQQSDRSPQNFPESYFAKDDKGRSYLLPIFVSKEKVDSLASYLAKGNLTTGQMRRFFNHCREIERRLTVDDESWERVSASFGSLCVHAQNAKAANKIPGGFQKFIDGNVKRVTSSDDPKTAFLDGFLPHFEALVGFGAAHMKDR